MARMKRLALSAGAVAAIAMIAAPTHAQRGIQNTPPAVTTVSGDSLERGIVRELNSVRGDPLAEIPKLPGKYTPAQTADAVNFLQRQAADPPLHWSTRLAMAARVQVLDQADADPPGHIGRDGSNPMTRMRAQGWNAMLTAEEISVGESTAAGAIRQLIVDIPGPKHPHRYDLFSDPTIRYIGIACGPNRHYVIICVIDLSASPIVEVERG
jgi:uncharacterized protein YkwD